MSSAGIVTLRAQTAFVRQGNVLPTCYEYEFPISYYFAMVGVFSLCAVLKVQHYIAASVKCLYTP